MRRIAYLNGRTYRGAPIARDQVPPLEVDDRVLIFDAGAESGLTFETVYWDEPDLAQRFDAAIIRTCWDYHRHMPRFVETLEAHERAGLRVFNPSPVVRWNANKTYLNELGDAAIPTVWIERVDGHAVAQAFDHLDAAEIVLKPQMGAGSIGTIRLKRNAWSEGDLINGPQRPAMAQPFLQSIETEGERSLFWFGGAYSHAVRKRPHNGHWLANIPSAAEFFAEEPPAAARAAAEAALARTPQGLLYVRVDLVLADDDSWRVIEIEAIEPYLFLRFAPEAARTFVGAIATVLG